MIRTLWRTSRPLTAVAAVMFAMFFVFAAGMLVDPRTITGAPAWLKPAKFAISTAIYSVTLAWVFGALPAWPRVRAVGGWATALVFVVEVAIIAAQAWRGTTSHFNIGTPLDTTLFGVMGILIILQTLASAMVAVALWREHRFDDRAMGWALRFGMALTIAGASTGGLMTRPTAAQLEQARVTHVLSVAGAHTVGAPDGGAGMPGVGWSREHGDLRVPHFVGLHALQVLPLVVVLLRRRGWPERLRIRALFTASAVYAGTFAVLAAQALRGQSLLQPDGVTLVTLTSVAAVGSAVWLAMSARRPVVVPAVP